MTQQSLPPQPDGDFNEPSGEPATMNAADAQQSSDAVDEPRVLVADRAKDLPLRARQALKAVGQMIEQRRLDEAERSLAKVRAQAGDHPEFMRMLAVTLHLKGRYGEAAALLRRALEKSPNDPLILTNLGSVLKADGDAMGATVAFQRACELDPKMAAPWYNLGNALTQQLRVDEALNAFEEALRRDPEHMKALHARAGLFIALGRIDEGVDEFRRVLAHRPDSIAAWSGLTGIKTAHLTDAETAQLEALYAAPHVSDPTRNRYGFALAKALEDQGRYAEAFVVLSSCNAATRRQHTWDAEQFTRAIDQVIETFAKPIAQASDPTLGKEVIFVVSIPRSGSTLTEHILASHSEVSGADELPIVGDLLNQEAARRGVPYPNWLQLANAADWTRLGREYLKRTERWRKSRSRSTDKGLSNWAFVGVIHAMLPGARIVNCRRDPVETCWSCFKQDFGTKQSYSYDMTELASYWRDYDRMMRFWHAHYPHRVHDMVYEDLVDDPETQIRRLLSFCDLPFEPTCLRFNETQRAVRTMSAGQVRQPLRHDTARAPAYGELLAPLRWALGIEKVGVVKSS
jgi:tetratricopeptide (TPR) repeat protein